jgi:hypothetical protein
VCVYTRTTHELQHFETNRLKKDTVRVKMLYYTTTCTVKIGGIIINKLSLFLMNSNIPLFFICFNFIIIFLILVHLSLLWNKQVFLYFFFFLFSFCFIFFFYSSFFLNSYSSPFSLSIIQQLFFHLL